MPYLDTNAVVGEVNDGTTLSFKEKIFIKKELVFQQKLSSKVTIEVFQKIFIENLDWIKALKYFYKNYKLKNNESLIKLKNETELLSVIKIYEKLDCGFAEIY